MLMNTQLKPELSIDQTTARYAQCTTIAAKRAFWREHPVDGDVEIRLPGIPTFSMHCENDDTVVKELYWTGFHGWEVTSLRLWYEFVCSGDSGVVLDIGTYSGIYSLIAARQETVETVHAFDVQEACINRLVHNCKLNAASKVDLVLAACVASAGPVQFHYYAEKDILSSVAGVIPKAISNRTATVDGLVVDDYLETVVPGNHVKLVKIDVEGARNSHCRPNPWRKSWRCLRSGIGEIGRALRVDPGVGSQSARCTEPSS